MTPKTMGAAPVTGSAGAPRASARPSTSEAMTSEIPLLIARLLSAGRDDRSPSIRTDMCSRPVCFPLPAAPLSWTVARTPANPGSRGSWGTGAGVSRGSRKAFRKGITQSDRVVPPTCRGAFQADIVCGLGRGEGKYVCSKAHQTSPREGQSTTTGLSHRPQPAGTLFHAFPRYAVHCRFRRVLQTIEPGLGEDAWIHPRGTDGKALRRFCPPRRPGGDGRGGQEAHGRRRDGFL